jgi:hypothetical protein
MQRFVEPVPERPFTLPVIVGTSLSEGKQFIERLSDLCALNVLGKSALPELQALLFEKLGMSRQAARNPSFDY